MLSLQTCFNLLGLLLITLGSILAALNLPGPIINKDLSVSLANPDPIVRAKQYRSQQLLPYMLSLIGFGAILQAIAVFL